MARTTGSKDAAKANAKLAQGSRTGKIAERGVSTGREFAKLMSALMSDVIEGKISPQVANATCNAGGKLLKVVELQYRYANSGSGDLNLAGDGGVEPIDQPKLLRRRA
jgi:hypothetical protein